MIARTCDSLDPRVSNDPITSVDRNISSSRFDASSTRPSSRGVTLSAKLTDAWWSILAANAREHWAVEVNRTRRYRTRESTPARGTLHGLPRRRCAAVGSRRLMPSLLVGGLLAACSSVGSQHRAQTGVLSSASLSA